MNLFSSALRLTVLAGALLLGASHAATITWGAATTISGDGDILNTGTKVGAFNIGTTATPGTTINGVTFDAFGITGNSNTVGNFNLSSNSLGGTTVGFNSTAAPFSSLSTSYRTLLQSGAADTTGNPMTLTMNNLTVGTNYSFQWWANDSGTSNLNRVGVTATSGNSVTLDPNTTNAVGGVGQFAIGTFTANSAQQVVTFANAGGTYPILDGFQLRSSVAPVPEPSTYAMMFLGVGALGLVTWKRKRSANSDADFAATAI